MPSVDMFTPLVHFSLFESMVIGLLYWYLLSSLVSILLAIRSTISKARLQYRPMCFPLFVVLSDDVVQCRRGSGLDHLPLVFPSFPSFFLPSQ
jgi:hypothetical protein